MSYSTHTSWNASVHQVAPPIPTPQALQPNTQPLSATHGARPAPLVTLIVMWVVIAAIGLAGFQLAFWIGAPVLAWFTWRATR